MAFRLMKKAVLMMLREKRIFVVFTLIYTTLIFLTSLFIDLAIGESFAGTAIMFVFVFFGTSLFLSILYAWILVGRKKRVFATLKCIGWTNKNILSLVSGMILFTTLIGLIIVIEVLFHYSAAITYVESANLVTGIPSVLIGLVPVITTTVLYLIVQILAIAIVYRKVLKVRPIIALKRVGE